MFSIPHSLVAYSINTSLKGALEEAVFSQDGLRSLHYHLIAGDLRDMNALGEKILSRGIDTRLDHALGVPDDENGI